MVSPIQGLRMRAAIQASRRKASRSTLSAPVIAFGNFRTTRRFSIVIIRFEDPRVAAVRQHGAQMESVDGRAGLRHRQQGEAGGGKGEIGVVGRRQADDVDHQRRGVVAGARREPGGDELARGRVGRVALRQDCGERGVRDAAMDAVAAQEVAIVEADGIACIIDADALVGTDRPGEDVPQAGAGHRMVGRQPVERAVPPAIGAGVADMDDVHAPPAQDERGQRRRHAGERRVARAHRMRPGIEGLDGAGAVALDAQRRVLPEMPVDEGAHRKLCRHPTALRAADAIGDHRDRTETHLLLVAAHVERGVVLVRLARTGIGRDAEAKLEPGRGVGRGFAGGAGGSMAFNVSRRSRRKQLPLEWRTKNRRGDEQFGAQNILPLINPLNSRLFVASAGAVTGYDPG